MFLSAPYREHQFQFLGGEKTPVAQQESIVRATEQPRVLREPNLEETGFYQNQLIVLR